MKNHLARFMARLSAFDGGHKNNIKFIAADFAKTAFLNQVVYEGIAPLLSGRKGGKSMTPDHEEHKRHTFDSYCKSVLKRTARECYGAIKRRGEREVAFSELSARELASLSVTDEYFTDEYVFSVLGESVGVTDADLAEALNTLTVDRREIVLMSYFFEMTDKEIAEKLNMARRTVAYRRTSSLRELKKRMESED